MATADCRKGLLAAIALAAIAGAYTWPLVVVSTSAIAHDRGDPLLVTWILWWTSHTIPLTDAWWNAPAFYPSSGVLAFSENLLGLAPITAPIVRATGSPILAYNVAFLLSYVLSGLGAYLLAFVLTRCHGAAFVAGVAFAFAPYRLSHTQHLQLLSSYWMPVAIAALHLYLNDPRWRWGALFAVAWLLQALASGYYLFFLSTFAVVWLAWFVPGRLPIRQTTRLAAAWIAAGLVLLPLLLGYRTIHGMYGFHRSPVEVVNYSADVAGILSASPFSLIWGWLHADVGSESEQFPGITVLIVLFMGLTGRRWLAPKVPTTSGASHRERGPLGFFVGAAGLMWLLSLGPAPRVAGTAIGLPGPYAILAMLPGFDGMRVPARLWMVAVLCLATAAALVVARIQNRRARRIAIALSVTGLLLDAWPRAFPIVAAPGMRVTASQARARLGLPLHETSTETMYGAIAQRRSVFNGYSGYAAPQHAALRDLLEQRDRRILDRLAGAEPIEVIVESSGDADGQWNAFVAGHPKATRIGGGPDWTGYEISPTGAIAPAAIAGQTLPIARIETTANAPHINAVLDNDLDTRWHVVPQAGGETITVTLDEVRHVTAVVLCLGTYAGQYPRLIEVEVSTDSVAWSTVYTGGTALQTYDAALRSPREVPITLPVQRDGVKFLRLRQLGRDARRGWTIVELRVLG